MLRPFELGLLMAIHEQAFAALHMHGAKLLIIASTGGHVSQAFQIANYLDADPSSLFVTFDLPQTTSLVHNYRTKYVHYVAPRDILGIARAGNEILKILRVESFDGVLSTGAGLALSGLPLGKFFNLRSVYVESYSRFDGPSLTGRILRRIPGVETYSQHKRWATSVWPYIGDVGPQEIKTIVSPAKHGDGKMRILVTLGTIRPYRFDRLVDRLLTILPEHAEVTWQLGSTTRADLPGQVETGFSSTDFLKLVSSADVIVSHAGVGSAMTFADQGKRAILVPRRSAFNEHVDDHQVQLCKELHKRGLIIYREVDQLAVTDLI
jgi:UDP-N-acetylglucosamine--N-acetylmuramyl-(pentapeptide) pyrophosphoryl-undecaprenol N-acetylglucosamine transferase